MIDGWLPPPEPDWLQEDMGFEPIPLLGQVKIDTASGEAYVWAGGSWMKLQLLATPPIFNPGQSLFNVTIP